MSPDSKVQALFHIRGGPHFVKDIFSKEIKTMTISDVISERINEFGAMKDSFFSKNPWNRKNQSYFGHLNWIKVRDLNHLYEKWS